MEYQFDVNRVIGIKIYKSEKSDWVWLPRKERPSRFFGLIKVIKLFVILATSRNYKKLDLNVQ